MSKARAFKLLCGALLIAGAHVSDAAGELGRPFLQNFALRDYHAHNQNWAAVQDAQGILYFGNKNVVLEYDGVSWRKNSLSQTTYVRGLAIEPSTGRVFAGAVDELGYFERGANGENNYVSLLDKVPAEARDFRDIRRVYVTSGGVFFVAEQQVLRWRDGAFKTWRLPNASRLQSHVVADQLYVQHPDIGLLRLDGETFVPASNDPLFRRTQVTLLILERDGSITVGTNDEGLFTWRGDAVTPITTEIDAFLKERKIRRGLRLRDGSTALATAASGLVVLAPDGQLRSRVDESTDLQNDTILDLFEDREGVLWLCLNSGITRVEVTSPLTIFDTANGLKRTTIRDALRYRGVMHLAAGQGLYRIVGPAPGEARMPRCERIPGSEGEWWSLCEHDAGLLAGGMDGTVLLGNDGTPRRIAQFPALVLRRSRVDPERVFIGNRNGLRSIRRNSAGEWQDEGAVEGIKAEVRTIVENARGEVWLGTPISGVFRVTFAPGTAGGRGAAAVSTFFESHGLPKGHHWTRVIESQNGYALFATQEGLYRFDHAKQQFEPAPEFGRRFADGSFMLGSVAQDAEGDLWLAGRRPDGVWLDQELGRAFKSDKGGEARFETLPYKIADKIGEIEKFYPERGPAGEKAVWIGGTDGIVRVDVDRLTQLADAPPFAAVIRGAMTVAKGGPQGEPHSITSEPLPYAQNSVRFSFAANTYAIGSNLRYQTRLAGFEEGGWSEWTERTSADYTNLPEGSYVFEVRAQDVNGRVGTTASLPFRILPPWYRTFVAYAAYAIALAGVLMAAALWQLRRFRRKHEKLEALIAARTSELRAREEQLVGAMEAADSANRAKSAFLANMSHELRTPLNAILGYTQIMLKDQSQSSKNRERLATVDQSGNHLLAMINEVLDLSKIEAGKLTLNPTEFSLGDLISDVCAAFRQRVAEKGIEFACDCADDLARVVRGDAGKLRQILFNLLGNAVKFTASGRVSLELTAASPDRIRFEVKDTGIGIAPGDLRDIFLAFHQAAAARSVAQGTGLGLAISERLVQLLGGRLEVESEVGKGSRFSFEIDLPVVASVAAQFGVAVRRRDILPATPAGFRGRARRLLIADDAPTNRNVLRELLAPLGFEIEEAANGAECLQRCAAQRPDAILLDLQMPAVDGFEVARALRRNLGDSAPKIIAVSASVFEDARQHAIDAGCDDFLPKPFKEEQLLAVLGKALGLEWTYGEDMSATAEAADASLHRDGEMPPPEEIDAMLELSRRGDILGIKKRLTALASVEHGGYTTFVHGLEPFVASYQMNRIRDVLLRVKEEKAV